MRSSHVISCVTVVLCLALPGWTFPASANPAPPESVDHATPRRALRSFLEAAQQSRWQDAANLLDLESLSLDQRLRGPALAQQLYSALDQALTVDVDSLSDAPDGKSDDGPLVDEVGHIQLGGQRVTVALTRPPNKAAWRLGAETVAAIPLLHQHYGADWIDQLLPPVIRHTEFMGVAAWQWLGLVLLLLVSVLLAPLVGQVLMSTAHRVAARTSVAWDDRLITTSTPPVRVLLGVLLFSALTGPLHLNSVAREVCGQLVSTALVVTLTWLAFRLLDFGANLIESRLTMEVTDAARVRSVRTQVRVLYRVATVVLFLVGGALVLTQFQLMRHVGTSLLASAGVAGIVIGLAAQRSIAMLLAGIQLSITQPIRIGDTVIVENEWGWIEEITLTYVVVRVWDLRRLVVPITRFLDQPFQNWTKVTPDIMGTVFLFADYTVPVDAVRAELERVVKDHPLWDRKVVGLQVTDATDRVVQLRALMSSDDAGKNWDLRCDVREALIRFLKQLEGGRYLPRTRVAMDEGCGTTPVKHVA